ncbi:MAG: hypothetical protein AB3N64_14765 [Puniceicoccaceae bacterium]
MNLYSFDDPRRAIHIHTPTPPQPWINYLSNGRVHAFVSQAGGGLFWHKSAVSGRITRYRMHHLPLDTPGFYVYIRMPDGSVWSPSFRPAEAELDGFSCTHQPGVTTFNAEKSGIQAKLEMFICPDHDIMVWNLSLDSDLPEAIDVDVFAYMEFSLQDWKCEENFGYYRTHQVITRFDEEEQALLMIRRLNHPPLVYMASNVSLESWDGEREAFLGHYRTEFNPAAVEKGRCSGKELPTGHPCGALHPRLSLKPGESANVSFFAGVAEILDKDFEKAKATMRQSLSSLRKTGGVQEQKQKLNEWWERHFDAFQCSIPHESAQRQINTWSAVNTVHTGRYSRAVSRLAPGSRGVGFRDTCQDMLSIAYRQPDWAAEVFSFLLSQQFRDGHTVHFCYPDDPEGPYLSTRSDNHLWLPLLAYAIVAETGDVSLLDRKVAWYDDSTEATVWEHLLASICFAMDNRGSHGLPLLFGSDWNDSIAEMYHTKEGRAESIFAAQQAVVAINRMIPLAEALGDNESLNWLEESHRTLTAAILESAWDGEWWRRGYDDNGHPMGSSASEVGKLFLNTQSWAVLSGIGTLEQRQIGMDAVEENLLTDVGLKACHPGFIPWPEDPDSHCGSSRGTNENGAIFCHANTWAIIAEALLGNADRAWKYFTQLIPAEVAKTVGIERYAAEPYAWVSQIIGPENDRYGWANVEHVTGTATWMDVAATQYLLGVRAELDGLRIDPCVPADFKKFSITRSFRDCTVVIDIEHRSGQGRGVQSLTLDGKPVSLEKGPVIPASLLAGKARVQVQVLM